MSCRHKRSGIVTNQPNGYDPTLPHASTTTCDRDGCIQKAIRWVAGETNMTAYLKRDADRLWNTRKDAPT
jgi:hypothetical protein